MMLEMQKIWLLAKQHLSAGVIVSLTAVSAIMAIASIVFIPIVLCRLPPDYFLHEKPHLLTRIRKSSPAKSLILIVKNIAGFVLILAGILMLFLPGQGLLTMLIGMILMDFPGKFHLERKIIAKPKILAAINWLRRRRGHPDLQV